MKETTMTELEATNYIHSIRIKSPFTMSMTLEEYVDYFIKNYAMWFKEILPKDVMIIAAKMKDLY